MGAVFTHIRGQNKDFSAFYKDNSILIQFLIEEFIRSFQLNFQINRLLEDQLGSSQNISTICTPCLRILLQLIGHPSQQEKSLASLWTKGPLTRFKEYCEHFSSNTFHQNKEHVNLHIATQHAWLMAVYIFELLNSYATNPSILFLMPLKRAFNLLQKRFNQIGKYIPRVTSAYWKNENVILCLLHKKNILEEIYGLESLYKWFKWPEKTADLNKMLVERYRLRGFQDILPIIQSLFAKEEAIV